MKITIKEPVTDSELDLDAQPEDYNGEQGWRIPFPEKGFVCNSSKKNEWKVMDESDINPELVEAIGKALHPHARYNSQILK